MTVGELIAELQALDPELPVVVDGYEDGFAAGIQVTEVYLVENGHGASDAIYGRHKRPGARADVPGPGWNLRAVFVGQGRNLEAGW